MKEDRRPATGGDLREEAVEQLRFLQEIGVRELPRRRRSGREPASAVPEPEAAPEPPQAAAGGAAARLESLRANEIGDCRECRLCESRTNIVFGVGNPEARLMFVGEGPGRDEDAQGIPFVGRAGQLLTDIIKAMNLTREQVYIANIVKCRPPKNRAPEPDEIEACRGYLEKQIEIIAPEMIVCLGGVAAQTLLGTSIGITRLRGELRSFAGVPVMPTYHPAYLLRSPQKKRDVWEDMKQVMEMLGL